MSETTITIEQQIAAPPAQVWEMITDTRRYAEWVVNTLEVTRADSDRADAGVTYDERNRIAGPLTGSSSWLVTAARAPQHTVHTGRGIWLAGPMRLEMTVEPQGDGTRYLHVFSYEPGLGPLAPLVGRLLTPSIDRDMRRSVQTLREICEREAP